MNINENVWEDIKTLMEQSFWGRNSTTDSLIIDLNNEVKEFKQGCEKDDVENSMEEAADVMMIMFCLLYRIKDMNEEISIDQIMENISAKLKSRYKHLYLKNEKLEEEEEKKVWKSAKSIENIINYMFCDNNSCNFCGKVGGANIKVADNNFFCAYCNKQLFVSKKNLLFYNKPNRKKYIQLIIDSIINYAKGNITAPEILRIDNLDVYNSLYNDILMSDNHLKDYFIEYICEKYKLMKLDVIQYCDAVIEGYCITTNDEVLKYIQEIAKGNYNYMRYLPNGEPIKLMNKIKYLTMDVEKRIEKVIKYEARNWNNQLVHKYLLNYNQDGKNRIIECMTIIHYQDEKIRDLTIELSNMYNCVVGCRFCASGALPEETCFLEAIDYVKQLNTCLRESGVNPNEFDNFYVSFAGIGEPSVVYKEIADGMIMIKDLFPKVEFNIATFGFDIDCFNYWNKLDLPIRTLQIPFYSSKPDQLKFIVKNLPSSYKFETVIDKALEYKKSHENCRVKVNYIAMKDINDKDQDVDNFCAGLMKYKSQITIRVSYLNYTKPGEQNNIIAANSERLLEIKKIIEKSGFECYIFGTNVNTELGCGQLAQNHISSRE